MNKCWPSYMLDEDNAGYTCIVMCNCHCKHVNKLNLGQNTTVLEDMCALTSTDVDRFCFYVWNLHMKSEWHVAPQISFNVVFCFFVFVFFLILR